jgi:hypothetical protein
MSSYQYPDALPVTTGGWWDILIDGLEFGAREMTCGRVRWRLARRSMCRIGASR